jgi:fructosamine-3-kinase
MPLPPPVLEACGQLLGSSAQRAAPVSGGDINEAYRLETAHGPVFLKLNRSPQALAMFEDEARGLALLGTPGALAVPAVLGTGEAGGAAFLLLEHIQEGPRRTGFWRDFGSGLAQLHRTTQAHFGLDHDNFIGSLPQRNRTHPDWPGFYAQERLWPQLGQARSLGLLQQEDEQMLSRLCTRLTELCPGEPPALIHGDLWSGNFLAGSAGQPFLIDPSVGYAHREMDLAMSRLFGGFAPEFYRAYHEAYPLAPGLEERLEAYQLYYLLVHVNLFGQGYVPGVRRILRRYG